MVCSIHTCPTCSKGRLGRWVGVLLAQPGSVNLRAFPRGLGLSEGPVALTVERRLGMAEVPGSNPGRST